jgi:hypothetical protein
VSEEGLPVRDDLHHSLAQTHPWRKVVQVACAPGLEGELVDALSRAIWATQEARLKDSWWQQFFQVLATQQGDLFGTEQMQRELSTLESLCPSSDARRALDIAFAEVLANQTSGDLKDRVVHSFLKASAEDGIEGAVAWVAKRHPETQLRPLRAALFADLLKCDLREPPVPKKRRPRPTVEQGLATELPLTV